MTLIYKCPLPKQIIEKFFKLNNFSPSTEILFFARPVNNFQTTEASLIDSLDKNLRSLVILI
jgi:hypothetical protein